MQIEKRFTVEAPRERVWRFITTPQDVAPCIPGVEEVEELEPSKYRAAIKIQVGPIKTVFHVQIQATEERAPEYAAYLTQGEEGSRASRLKAESSLSLRSLGENETEVVYRSDMKILGRLGKFGAGIMKKKADSLGGEFVEALKAKLESDARGEV